jgi:hypothetical protein
MILARNLRRREKNAGVLAIRYLKFYNQYVYDSHGTRPLGVSTIAATTLLPISPT